MSIINKFFPIGGTLIFKTMEKYTQKYFKNYDFDELMAKFQPYFEEQQRKRHEKEKAIFENREFKEFNNCTYIRSQLKEERLKNTGIDGVIRELEAFRDFAKDKPIRSIEVGAYIEQEPYNYQIDEEGVNITYVEYNFRENYKSTYSARDAAWKLKNQFNGKDAKRYLEIYKKL